MSQQTVSPTSIHVSIPSHSSTQPILQTRSKPQQWSQLATSEPLPSTHGDTLSPAVSSAMSPLGMTASKLGHPHGLFVLSNLALLVSASLTLTLLDRHSENPSSQKIVPLPDSASSAPRRRSLAGLPQAAARDRIRCWARLVRRRRKGGRRGQVFGTCSAARGRGAPSRNPYMLGQFG